jgi:hypothetical protein
VIEQVEKVRSEAQMLFFPNLEYFLQGQVHILLREPLRNSSKPRSQQDCNQNCKEVASGRFSDRQIDRDLKPQYAFFEGYLWGSVHGRTRIFPPDEQGHRDDPPGQAAEGEDVATSVGSVN